MMGRPSQVMVSPQKAFAAALDLIDAHGVEAFTVRRLAQALGVTSAALYHHFEDKDAILDGVVRLVLRDVRETDRNRPWTEQFASDAVSYRAAVMAHPRAAPLLVGHPYRRFAMHMVENSALALARAGVPAGLIPVITQCMESFAFGSALNDSASIDEPVPEDLPPLNEYPDVRRSLAHPPDRDVAFATGVDALLAGFVRLIQSKKTGKTSRPVPSAGPVRRAPPGPGKPIVKRRAAP